jgi:hypothetical protein
MFGNSMMGGLNLGFPDVCLTPPVPEPIPYPNLSIGPMAVPAVYNVLWCCTPALNLLSTNVMSQGDDPGIALGLVSHLVMGPTRPVTGAFTVLVGGIPATRLTSINEQNLFNSPGMSITPSQLNVLLLAP